MPSKSEIQNIVIDIGQHKASAKHEKLMRMVEHEMSEAFRLTKPEHPFLQELKRLCLERRYSLLAAGQGSSNE